MTICNPTFYYVHQPNCQSFLSERKLCALTPTMPMQIHTQIQTVIKQRQEKQENVLKKIQGERAFVYSPAGYSNLQSTKTACPVLVLVSKIRPSSMMTSASKGHHVPGPSYGYLLHRRGQMSLHISNSLNPSHPVRFDSVPIKDYTH